VAPACARGSGEGEAAVSELELRIQDAIRVDATRSREVERLGPFLAAFTPGTANPFLNYAIPEPGAAPAAADVETLSAAFARRKLRPRLEFVPGIAPLVEPALVRAGFLVELRTPLMRFTGLDSFAAPAGIELVEATDAETIRAAVGVQHEAYDESEPPSEARLAGVARSLDAGGLLVLARDAETHEPAGAGQCVPPAEGAAELTSVGVRPSFRRRGIAQALTAWLATTMTAHGADLIFLMAHGDREAAIYERSGFERVGEVLHISAPAT
jgi:ribosomal protein S18 acetylase RimI-like enzyme